ncbi:hypothetical protein RND71_020630 [Anisodus tanguticus]|uniref:Major facilitator superfamily (MFS) profile domain-containing protein n=1 Tax=Anisodus tanguticus TaxID=243964 RepID=A0AAE1S1B7_9SOLA|nr:hypothetical protein RND71_020630 [Anisodus tanguticus]
MSSAQMNNSKITIYVLSCWILAAFGGLIFGYDIGISGGNLSYFGKKFDGDRNLGQETAVVVLLVCTFVMAFAWSWGPLGWLIPSETFPLETRTAGFAFAGSAQTCSFTAGIAQAFLTILCTMQAYTFFFSAWIAFMGICAIFFLLETKGIPIDAMVERPWMHHPVWKKLF